MEDTYLTADHEDRTEIKVKGSRFIAESFLVGTVDEALEKLESVRKREYVATHHCYAYVVGIAGAPHFRYSDCGEPSGTAGKPIYDVIVGRGLTNLMVVVTRYFGGTKLGTGGLAHAYSDAARAVVDLSGVGTNYIKRRFRCDLDFSYYDIWQRELHRLEANIVDAQFAERVTLVVEIRLSRVEQLATRFAEVTSGKGRLEEIGA